MTITKFLLEGGVPNKAEDGGKAFCEEMIAGFDTPIRILECLFARPENEWHGKYQEHTYFLASKLPGVRLLFSLARPTEFVEQLKKTDIVFFRGGNTSLLIETLNGCPGWERELEGKTVVGTSAGANFLARYNYGLNELMARDGLGILPIKVLVHYRSDFNAPNVDWDMAEKELRNYGEDLPLVTLREGEFKVFEA